MTHTAGHSPNNPFGAGGEDPENTNGVENTDISDADYDWTAKFRTDAVTYLERVGADYGFDRFTMESFVRNNIDAAIDYINERQSLASGRFGGDSILERGRNKAVNKDTAFNFQRMWEDGMTFFSMEAGINFVNPRPPGGGSGRRRPSAADIRKSFDVDQLSEQINKMWNAYLIEDNAQARTLAKSYVEAIVDTKGEQEIDFQTFVLDKIRKDKRHGLLYRNKPEGLDELAYLTPFVQSAASVVGGQNKGLMKGLATGGAALGASGAQFQERLRHTTQNQQSSGFINQIEERVRGIKDVLRG
jgi:hypothetical protein